MRVLVLMMTGCGFAPWTENMVLAPVLAHLDGDGNGSVEQSEWEDVAYEAPPFSFVDADGDGKLDAEELMVTLLEQDPLVFDAATPKSAPDQSLQSVYFADSWPVRVVRDALRFQAAEIRAVQPDYPLPSDERLRSVARGMDRPSSDLADTCASLLRGTRAVRLEVPAWLERCGDSS